MEKRKPGMMSAAAYVRMTIRMEQDAFEVKYGEPVRAVVIARTGTINFRRPVATKGHQQPMAEAIQQERDWYKSRS